MIPRIRQVQIRNFKSIGQAVVDLEPFTALVGANGSGKSNFLDCLHFIQLCLMLSPPLAILSQGGIRRIAPRWQALTPSSTGFRLSIDLDQERSADYSFEIAWDEADIPRVAQERCHVRGPQEEQVFEVADGQFRREIPGVRTHIRADRLALSVASATEEFRPVYYFLTDMQFYSLEPGELKRSSSLVVGPPDSVRSNAADVLMRLSKLPGRVAYDRINHLLSKAVPGIRGVYPRETGENGTGIEFTQEIGTTQPASFEASEMSDGTLRLLGLLLAVYQPHRSSLVAIEEPEATIHPAVAELVLQVLLDAAHEKQVLITTHSPDILDAKEISDKQIRVVTMAQGRTTIAPLAQASRQAIHEHLYTPGELLRSNELNQDAQAASEAAEHLDLFGEVPATTRR